MWPVGRIRPTGHIGPVECAGLPLPGLSPQYPLVTEVRMSLWEAALLGVVQGLTEFLPISSTAHLLVVRQLLHHENPRDAFTTAIQLGTLVAVFVYFRADVARLLRALVADIKALRPGTTPDARLAGRSSSAPSRPSFAGRCSRISSRASCTRRG